jgi:hypothetical protein
MRFTYSCFISYSHGQGDLIRKFTDQLKAALENYLGPYMTERVYLDRDRLQTGFQYNEALAEAICQSVCMIVVYSPLYERRPYCLREYRAMELIEQKRKKNLGGRADRTRGIIYPIIFRVNSDDDVPPKIKQTTIHCDFSKFTLATLEIGMNSDYIDKIEDIARDIHEHYKAFI